MNRREFVKLCSAVGFGGMMLPPGSWISVDDIKDPMKWFRENYDWLIKWLNYNISVLENERMQIFKSSSTIYKTAIYKTARSSEDYLPFIAEKRNEHLFDILRHSVFGRGQQGLVPINMMSGFVEQKGRYPTIDDKVRFEYLGENWCKAIEYTWGWRRKYTFVTECRLKVL